AFGNGVARDSVHGRFLKHRRLEMRMVSDDAADVDAGASGKVQELPVVLQVQRLGNSSSEINAATIHRGGELIGERTVLHRLRPFLFALATAPVRRCVGAQNVKKSSHTRAAARRSVA